jgi:hypothetical protein
MANGLIDIGTGAAQVIGRYFSVISVIPSSLYTVFVYVLIASDSLHHSPNWSDSFKSLEQLGVGGIAFLAFLSIALGVLIHPAQFAIVQFFEGYWGNSRIARVARAQRIIRYQRLCHDLRKSRINAKKKLPQPPIAEAGRAASRAALLSEIGEADRIRAGFPDDLDYVMPTRLGNVLRRAESQAGSQYGLDALQVVPHLLLAAPQSHVDYVNDQRSQLDLAVRMTFMSSLAAPTAVLFLWPWHFWILIALVPYVLAYLSYRGSVVAASHYGSALDTLINLDRFELYKQLHLPLPAGIKAEQETNRTLTRLFNYESPAIIYQHPAASDKE